jgi:hypothetical protein
VGDGCTAYLFTEPRFTKVKLGCLFRLIFILDLVFVRGFMKQDDPRPQDPEKASFSKGDLIYSKDGVDLTLIR